MLANVFMGFAFTWGGGFGVHCFCFPMIVGVIANDGTLLMLYIKPDI